MNLYQLSTIIIMDKAKAAKYSKLTIVYFIGVAVIVYGLYAFLTTTGGESTSNSFYMMFSGLVVATAGSIYGHNKVAGPGIKSAGAEPPKEDKKSQAKEEKMDDKIAKAMAADKDSAKRLEELKKMEKEEAKRLEELRKEEEKEMKRIEEEQKKEEERLAKEAMKEAKEIEAKSAPAKAKPAAGGVVKIIICPSCGEENKYTAKFCDNCGKKMRP